MIPMDVVTGKGWLVFDVLLLVGCFAAAISHLALLRSPFFIEVGFRAAMRRIKLVCWALLTIRLTALLWEFHDLPISLYAVILLLLLAWADALMALDFLKQVHPTPECMKL